MGWKMEWRVTEEVRTRQGGQKEGEVRGEQKGGGREAKKDQEQLGRVRCVYSLKLSRQGRDIFRIMDSTLKSSKKTLLRMCILHNNNYYNIQTLKQSHCALHSVPDSQADTIIINTTTSKRETDLNSNLIKIFIVIYMYCVYIAQSHCLCTQVTALGVLCCFALLFV